MNLFRNKFRIPSSRLHGYDYSQAGMYFVTVNTRKPNPYFGEIKNGVMVLNTFGQFVNDEWLATPSVRPDMNLELGEYVVMPDHFHGIILIGKNIYNSQGRITNYFYKRTAQQKSGEDFDKDQMKDFPAIPPIPSHPYFPSLPPLPPPPSNIAVRLETGANKFAPQSKNLASIMRGFKSSVTTFARYNGIEFDWQERYHDHIIRNKYELERISKYIHDNPANWDRNL